MSMRSSPSDVHAGESKTELAQRSFRSEMERRLLEIQEAFAAYIEDAERRRRDAEQRLTEMERQKSEAEDRLSAVERQKQAAEDRLREVAAELRRLQKTRPIRIARFLRRIIG